MAEEKLQSNIDNTNKSAGFNQNGQYIQNQNSNYLKNATSLSDADNKLDSKINENERNILTLDSRTKQQASALDNLRNELGEMENKLNQVEKDSYRGIASLAAINNAPIPNKVGGYSLAIGAGNYKSESAVGISFAYRAGSETGYAVISGGVGYALSGDPVYKAGIAWQH